VCTIVDDETINERVMLEQRRRSVAHEKIDWCPRKRATEVLQQRRRQRDIAKSSQLHDQHTARMDDGRRLHSALRQSLAYCTNA